MDEAYDIASAWAGALADSGELADFCQDRFDAELKIMLGYKFVHKPDERLAPWIMLLPMEDAGGFEVEKQNSTILVAFGIADEEKLTRADGVEEQRGYQSIKLMEEIMRTAMAATDFPPSAWEGPTTQPGEGYFEAHRTYYVIQDRTI